MVVLFHAREREDYGQVEESQVRETVKLSGLACDHFACDCWHVTVVHSPNTPYDEHR